MGLEISATLKDLPVSADSGGQKAQKHDCSGDFFDRSSIPIEEYLKTNLKKLMDLKKDSISVHLY